MRIPPRGVLSVLRHGRGDADRLGRLQDGAAGGPLVRRPGAREQSVVDAVARRRRRSGAGRLRRHAARPGDRDRRSGHDDPLRRRTKSARSGSRGRAWPRAIGSGPRKPTHTFHAHLSGRRRAVSAHRRSGLHARRRAVRHRPAQRPDHRPRGESLSAGHRDDRRAEPSQACGSGAGAAFTVEIDGRERLVIVHEVERGGNASRDSRRVFDAVRRAVCRRSTNWPSRRSCCIKAGSIPKTSSGKIQRHACRDGFLDGTLDVVGQWRAWDAAAKRAAQAQREAARHRPVAPADGRRPSANGHSVVCRRRRIAVDARESAAAEPAPISETTGARSSSSRFAASPRSGPTI